VQESAGSHHAVIRRPDIDPLSTDA
jgi:hypothetical protein